jgi:hypothetical protein
MVERIEVVSRLEAVNAVSKSAHQPTSARPRRYIIRLSRCPWDISPVCQGQAHVGLQLITFYPGWEEWWRRLR